jgi:(1->4)-alpha-D-glucan 1-alpha-D-glucosylmutase
VIPRATYRLQFHKDFTFEDAARRAEYFEKLGISHIYASPILTARVGSTHGYDVVDHSQINPELGGEDGFRDMAATLRAHGIGTIVDIVPNHMAVGRNDNVWWRDVLANGRGSRFAESFDIDWDTPGLQGKVLAPFLGAPPAETLRTGELKLVREVETIFFAYYDHRFPLRAEDQAELRESFETLGREALLRLLERQHFVLCDWREADSRINWRRFFDITDLAALRMDDEPTFEAVHAKIFKLYEEGLIDGVRVDHIDGLADPRAYCRKLRERLTRLGAVRRDRAYIIVEKILAWEEELPFDGEVDGTTGYDFMNLISLLQHAPDRSKELERVWTDISGRSADFEQKERQARREVLASKFSAQLDATARAFAKVTGREIDFQQLRDTLIEIITALRCYRSYATGKMDSPPIGSILEQAIAAASNAGLARTIADILSDKHNNPDKVDAIRHFNQLCAPVAAKAVEDSALYRYGRLLSRNDVGFDPREQSISTATFHNAVTRRSAQFPYSMLTTATHDHKRGEDARARLAVLSEIPAEWGHTVRTWFDVNRAVRPPDLDAGDEYQIYQTLIGLWPVQRSLEADLSDRIEQWCLKHIREAGLRSNWRAPNTTYETQFQSFAGKLITAPETASFRDALQTFVERIGPAGYANTIVQTVLRYTLPGVPDLYQGCEFEDHSLVDPDNRRPVDFDARERALRDEAGKPVENNRIKQCVIATLLQFRQSEPQLFDGEYVPLTVEGADREHVVAFARVSPAGSFLVAALRHATSFTSTPIEAKLVPLDNLTPYRDLLSGFKMDRAQIPLQRLVDILPAMFLASERHIRT